MFYVSIKYSCIDVIDFRKNQLASAIRFHQRCSFRRSCSVPGIADVAAPRFQKLFSYMRLSLLLTQFLHYAFMCVSFENANFQEALRVNTDTESAEIIFGPICPPVIPFISTLEVAVMYETTRRLLVIPP